MILLFVFNQASGQTHEMQLLPDDSTLVEIRFLKPLFEDGSGVSTMSAVYDNERLNFVGNINYNVLSIDGLGSFNGLGNIFLGVQFKKFTDFNTSKGMTWGVYLPTSSDDSFNLGPSANYYDLSKYFDDAISFYGNISSVKKLNSGLRIGYEFGPDIIFFTKDNGGDSFEALAHYGFSLGFNFSDFLVLAEILGNVIITESGDFDAITNHSYSFGFGYNGGRVSPRIFYKDYFDNELAGTKGILGIAVGININK
jgi:hypothetical protein